MIKSKLFFKIKKYKLYTIYTTAKIIWDDNGVIECFYERNVFLTFSQ